MIDFKNRGSHDLEVIIYKLRNYADYLEERIKDLEQEIKDLKNKRNNVIS
jgi:polyhydroxyalkanoate synthesis regulator phasin